MLHTYLKGQLVLFRHHGLVLFECDSIPFALMLLQAESWTGKGGEKGGTAWLKYKHDHLHLVRLCSSAGSMPLLQNRLLVFGRAIQITCLGHVA